jgi:polysaccharide export outer membrane protein
MLVSHVRAKKLMNRFPSLLSPPKTGVEAATLFVALAVILSARSGLRAQTASILNAGPSLTGSSASGPSSLDAAAATAALPNEKLGPSDLVEVRIANDANNSGRFRVSANGDLILGNLSRPIRAAGITPPQLAEALKRELVDEQLMVNPVVNVSAIEYRSRRVSVTGAVVRNVNFDVSGSVTLLDAIAMAGGVIPNMGELILFTAPHVDAQGDLQEVTETIAVRDLMSKTNLTSNRVLHGGEEIRVTEAAKFFVSGNVHHSGAFVMQPNADTTILKALALSEGLMEFSQKNAFIYRDADGGNRQEIPVPLSKIIARKTPDILLKPDDILYIPTSNAKRLTVRTLQAVIGFGTSTASGAIIYSR